MRVLITGSSGFIGSQLAAKCHELGHFVIATGQMNTEIERIRFERLKKQGVDVRLVGLGDRAQLSDSLTGCDVVFHLAAAQHEANVPDQYFRDVNVEGTRNLLQLSRDAGVGRFVHGSTIGVYGSALEGELDEDSETRPDNIYAVTKLEGEQVVHSFAGSMPVTIIRISETYGPGDLRLLKLFRAIKKRSFFVIGNGRNLHQLIYVDDLVRGLLAAAEKPTAVGNTFVLAGSERLTTTDMCETIAQAVHTKLPGFRAPLLPFNVAAICLETVCRPLGIQPPLHKRRLDFFRKTFLFDTTRAAQVLGFTPAVSFKEGATKTAEWYTATGDL
jgi:nucleoside-diphosphate-sugar epimerase